MDQQVTNNEILEAINHFADASELRFVAIESNIGSMKSDIGSMKSDIGSMKSDIGSIKATMVTKDYLDDKLADLRGDLVVLLRKEDNKFGALVTELLKEEVISQEAAKRILQMEPFPHLSL